MFTMIYLTIIATLDFFNQKRSMYKCVGWINKTTEEKEASREEYDAHILAKEQCREGIIKVCCNNRYYKLHVGTLTCFTTKEN